MAALIHPNIARIAEAYERALFPRLLGASILQRMDDAGDTADDHPDGRGQRKRKARTTRQQRTHPRDRDTAAPPSLSSSPTQGASEQAAQEEPHEEQGTQIDTCKNATASSSGTTNSNSRGSPSSSRSTSHQHGNGPSIEQLGLDGPALDDIPPPIRPIGDDHVDLPQPANQGRPRRIGQGDSNEEDSEAEAEVEAEVEAEDEDLTSFQIDLQPIPWPLFQSQIRRRIQNARKRGDEGTVPLIQELEISGRRWLVLLPEREFTRGQALRMLRSELGGGGGGEEGEMQVNWD